MPLNSLLTTLDTLIAQLQKSSNESANFFIGKAAELRAASTGSSDIREALERLSTCRAMAQYGNFSCAEENLLEAVIDAAARDLAVLPKP